MFIETLSLLKLTLSPRSVEKCLLPKMKLLCKNALKASLVFHTVIKDNKVCSSEQQNKVEKMSTQTSVTSVKIKISLSNLTTAVIDTNSHYNQLTVSNFDGQHMEISHEHWILH